MRRLLSPLALSMLLITACGEDDPGPNRPDPTDGGAPDEASDAGAVGDAQGAFTLSLMAALDESGVNGEIDRALLVVEAACKKLELCGYLPSAKFCTDQTLMDWTVGSLFFQAECLDAQLDTYSCWAKAECANQASCSPFRETQDAMCMLVE